MYKKYHALTGLFIMYIGGILGRTSDPSVRNGFVCERTLSLNYEKVTKFELIVVRR